MSKAVIVEKEPDTLPDHWSEIKQLDDGRRVMDKYDSTEKAERYLERMYGMYRSDAEVKLAEEIES